MNPYTMLSSSLDTRESAALSARLSAWHDAMVAHERLARLRRSCDDECPHVDAPVLWREAKELFGSRAGELIFLRSRGARQEARA